MLSSLSLETPKENEPMIGQILCKKFTMGQYQQMIESDILIDRDQIPGRGRVSLPRATPPTAQPIPANIQPIMLVDDKNPALGEGTSPLRQ